MVQYLAGLEAKLDKATFRADISFKQHIANLVEQDAKLDKTALRASVVFEQHIANLVAEMLKLVTMPKPEKPHEVRRFSARSEQAKRKLAMVNALLPQDLRVIGEDQLAEALNSLLKERNQAIHYGSWEQLEAAIASAVAGIDEDLRRGMPLECWLLENYVQLRQSLASSGSSCA